MKNTDLRSLNSDLKIKIRPIKPEDNAEIAYVIRGILEEHGVNRPGTVYTDPTTDLLYELFNRENAWYYIATDSGRIIGGCGIYPTEGLPDGYGELVKLYLEKEYRGTGIGKKLMEVAIEDAKGIYSALYLETMPELSNAIDLYKKMGFEMIDNRLGESGHFSCHIWMVKQMN